MSNLSIGLTFSEDGEYLQLSRMDAAILLTWIMGGDHDNEPEVVVTPPPAKEPERPTSAQAAQPPLLKETQGSSRPAMTRDEVPVRREPQAGPPAAPGLLPKNPPAARREAPPAPNKKAAQIIKEPVTVPDLPFEVTPNSAEFTKPPLAPTDNELLEEEPYWDYGTPPEPKL